MADSSNIVIREITPSGVVTIFAGNPEGGGTGCLYCDGSAAMAIFGDPVGVTVDGNGNVYVADYGGNTIRLISDGVVSTLAGNINVPGSTDGTGIGATFDDPESVAVTPSGSIYVADTANSTIREGTPAAPVTSALRFVPVAPCRVLDTRNASGPFGGPTITGGTSRNFTIPSGSCNIPSTAAAYSLNVAVVPTGPLGYLTLWPAGETQPLVATVSSVDGRVRSNAAIVPAGASGAVSVFASNTTDVVLDIDGYFVPATDSTALEFFRMTPCRLVDTRNPNGELGGPFLAGGATRLFLLAQSSCNLPGTARVYSLNVTAIPREPLGYLTAWAGGQAQPPTATLSAVTGTVTANAALVEAGADVTINVYASNDTDLVVDVDGYFAPAGTGGLSFYTLSPCRTLDTRQNAVGPLAATFDASVIWSGCGVPVSAQAYVFNATVVPPAPLGYLTLWPPGTSQPNAAALSALDGTVTSNMAVTPGASGSVDAFPSNPTQLILDIFGCFAP